MNIVEVFVIFVMSVALLMYVQNYYNEVDYVEAYTDKQYYLVRKLDDRQTAANILADINAKLILLTQHMLAKYPDSDDAKRLYKNYNRNALSEGSSESGYTSYSVNKGEKIVLCIRQSNNEFVDKNTIMYVAVHELAHIMTKEIGHTQTFWDNFKILLKEATKLKIYKNYNFNKKPKDYCGIKITSSILYNK